MKEKQYPATIGFWLVLGSSKEHPLLVCPAFIDDKTIKDINTISIEKAWKLQIQIPGNFNKDVITTMIPEIINITSINKPIKSGDNLWKLDSVRDKCTTLATTYIEQLKKVNKQNYG